MSAAAQEVIPTQRRIEMARVQLVAGELNHNFRVENAVAELLRRGESALISMASIEMYEVEDADGEPIVSADSLARLDQIVAMLHDHGIDDAEYEILGDDVRFRRIGS
jgi:xanthine/CO dehydrogenase XdhC/CoxF family maturation factor